MTRNRMHDMNSRWPILTLGILVLGESVVDVTALLIDAVVFTMTGTVVIGQ